MTFFNGIPENFTRNLELIDELGGPVGYNHCKYTRVGVGVRVGLRVGVGVGLVRVSTKDQELIDELGGLVGYNHCKSTRLIV